MIHASRMKMILRVMSMEAVVSHNYPTTTAPPRSKTNKNTAAPPGAPPTTAKQVNPAATTTAFPLNEFCLNKPNGNYVNPTTCLNFIMCSNGYGYLFVSIGCRAIRLLQHI